MKTLSETIDWYKSPEERRWKRAWNSASLWLIALIGLAILITIQIYGKGTALQPLFTLFILLVSLSSAFLALALFRSAEIRRWQIDLLVLGYVSAIGIAAIAGFLMLEVQKITA